jgi:hypothetical protein
MPHLREKPSDSALPISELEAFTIVRLYALAEYKINPPEIISLSCNMGEPTPYLQLSSVVVQYEESIPRQQSSSSLCDTESRHITSNCRGRRRAIWGVDSLPALVRHHCRARWEE